MLESADSAIWEIAEGRTNEYPFQVRFRKPSSNINKSHYPKRLNVFWSMRAPSDQGLATKEELEDLHTFEDQLVAAVERDESVILVAVLTGRSEREFVFYVKDPQIFVQRLSEMPQEEERYPIEIHLEDDPEWAYFESILPSEGSRLTLPSN